MEAKTCDHCGVPILYEETMVRQNDKMYCCRNCAAVHETSDPPGRQEMSEAEERSKVAAAKNSEPRARRPEGRGRQFR